ncbi:hypothetical protein TorRG33x02_167590, partial [Trema orientale]
MFETYGDGGSTNERIGTVIEDEIKQKVSLKSSSIVKNRARIETLEIIYDIETQQVDHKGMGDVHAKAARFLTRRETRTLAEK